MVLKRYSINCSDKYSVIASLIAIVCLVIAAIGHILYGHYILAFTEFLLIVFNVNLIRSQLPPKHLMDALLDSDSIYES